MLGLKETTSIKDRTVVCTADECLPSLRLRNLKSVSNMLIKVLNSMAIEDKGYFHAEEAYFVGLEFCDEMEMLLNEK